MSPRTRAKAVEVELPLNVREGLEEALRGETAALTHDEAERYFETPAMLANADVELDSPLFTPCELTEFAARGFARRNRWAAAERKR